MNSNTSKAMTGLCLIGTKITSLTPLPPIPPNDGAWDVVSYCWGSCSMSTPYGELSIHYDVKEPDYKEYEKTVKAFEQAINMTLGSRIKPTAVEVLRALNLESTVVNKAFADMLVKNEPELMNEMLYRISGRR